MKIDSMTLIGDNDDWWLIAVMMMMMMMMIRLPYGRIHIMKYMMIRGSIVAAAAVTDAVVVVSLSLPRCSS